MRDWRENPAAELEYVFGEIARTRMAGLPICNPALQVEAVAFRQLADRHWVGVMITPWAINLLRLSGDAETWPCLPSGSKHTWRFTTGDYEFIAAEEAELGSFHLCSLFSPASEFRSHEAARRLAEAIAEALDAPPPSLPDSGPRTASRRAFLGLGR